MKNLGIAYMQLPPGCRSFAAHFHYAHEETIDVREGKGRLPLTEYKIDILLARRKLLYEET